MLKNNYLKRKYQDIVRKSEYWANKNHSRLVLFNLIIVVLFLLHAVGYFSPFFPLTINFIVLLSFIISIFIFRAKSQDFFIVALFFWSLATIFRFMQVEAWVERASIYVYQSLIIGTVVLLVEALMKRYGQRRGNLK